jgi:NAD(P)-dependent dehydrogenase (short-subunit alcohol dehydrogenase family)
MRALVTGAAGGIGSAVAAAFVERGHTAFRHDMRGSGDMDVVGDLLQPAVTEDIKNFIRANEVDCVVAAHGLAGSAMLSGSDTSLIERTMLVNTISVMRLYDAVAHELAARDGVFVMVSSQAGVVGEAQNGVYSASKFALVGWARELARDTKKAIRPRLRVLCPGITETPLLVDAFRGMATASGRTYDEVLSSRLSQVPAARLARPSEIGHAAVWQAELQSSVCLVSVVNGGEILV